MRLYVATAVLTFVASFFAYSLMQMSGASRAIGGTRSGGTVSVAEQIKTYNPFLLLQPERLRALLSSRADIPRMQAFSPKFSTVPAGGVLPPRVSIEQRRFWSPTYQQYRAPVIHTAPTIRR